VNYFRDTGFCRFILFKKTSAPRSVDDERLLHSLSVTYLNVLKVTHCSPHCCKVQRSFIVSYCFRVLLLFIEFSMHCQHGDGFLLL